MQDFSAVVSIVKSTYTAWRYVLDSRGPGCQIRRKNFDGEECQETQDDKFKDNHNCNELSTWMEECSKLYAVNNTYLIANILLFVELINFIYNSVCDVLGCTPKHISAFCLD
jgi:hypothetical protein